MAHHCEPLCSWTARAHWLQAAAAVALGAAPAEDVFEIKTKEVATIAAVLFDCRIAALGARETMPLSCASVYASLVARFRGGIAGRESRPRVPFVNEAYLLAFTHDTRAFVAVNDIDDTLTEFDTSTGAARNRATVAYDAYDVKYKDGITYSTDIFVAADGFIFVSSHTALRVQVLTPFPDVKLHGCVEDCCEDDSEQDEISCLDTVCATSDFVLAGGGQLIYRFDRNDVRAPYIRAFVRDEVALMRPTHDGERVAVLTPTVLDIRRVTDFCVPERVIALDFPFERPSLWPLLFACSAFDEFLLLSNCSDGLKVTVLETDGRVAKSILFAGVFFTDSLRLMALAACHSIVALVMLDSIVFWG